MNLEELYGVDVPKMKSEPEIDDLEELERELGLEFEGKDEQNLDNNAEVEPTEKSNYSPDPKAAGPKVAKSGEYSQTVIPKPLNQNEENLRLHRNINAGVKVLVCKICKYRTWKKSNMKIHKRTHAAGSRPSCSSSSNANKWMETFAGMRNMNHSVNFSTAPSAKENSFKCDECNFEASHKWDLLEHKTTHSREAPCEFDGTDPNWFPETSRSKNTKAKPFSCDVCDYRSSLMGDMMKHNKLHTNNMPFACVTCNAKFKRKCHLVNHRRVHRDQKLFKCKYCNGSFKLKVTLKRHEVIHEKFLCNLCGYRTGLFSNMRAHKALHMGQTPSADDTRKSAFTRPLMARVRPTYTCEECPYKTGRKNELTIHMVTHTGKKPFTCAESGYGTVYEQNLNKHLKKSCKDGFCTKRERQIHHCETCEYSTTNKQDLTTHMVTHTGEKPFKCTDCEFGTVCEFNLGIHRQQMHPGTSAEDRQRKEGETDGSIEPAMYKETEQVTEMHLIDKGMDSTMHNEMESISPLEPGKDEHKNAVESTKLEVAGREELVVANQADHMSYKQTLGPSKSPCKDGEPTSAPAHDALVDSDGESFQETSRFKRIMRRLDTTSLLWTGVRRRTEAKPFTCNQCDYRSRWEFNLQKHLETHKEEKPHKCDQCDFQTGSLKGLKAHMKIRGHGSYEHGIQDSLARRSAELGENLVECPDKYDDDNQRYKFAHDTITAGEKRYQTIIPSYKTDDLPNPLPNQPLSPLFDHCGPGCIDMELEMTPTEHEADRIMLQADTEHGQLVDPVYTGVYQASKAEHKEAYRATDPVQTEKERAGPTPKKYFKCYECGFACDRISMLNGHMRAHNPNVTKASALVLVKHRSGTKRFGCPSCEYRSQYRNNVISHMRTHTGERPYQCHICNSRFSQYATMKKHLITHSENRETPHKRLNGDFETKRLNRLPNGTESSAESDDSLDQHTISCDASECVQMDHNTRLLHDQVVQVQGESGQLAKPHGKSDFDGVKAVLVKPIDGETNRLIAVKQHFRTSESLQHKMVEAVQKPSHPKKEAACKNVQTMNNPAVVQSEDARVHKKTSERNKPFVCDKCNYSAWNEYHFTIHMKLHLGEQTFKCYTCGYQTAKKGHLIRHQIVHTGEKPYKCDKCDFSSGYLHTLRAHKQRPDHKNLTPTRRKKCQESRSKANDVPEHSVKEDVVSAHIKNKPRAAYDAKTDQLIIPVDEQSNGEPQQSCRTDTSGYIESAQNDQLIPSSSDEDDQLANPEVDEIAQLTKRFREEVDQLIGSIRGQVQHSSKPSKVKHDQNNKPTLRMTAHGPRGPNEEDSYAHEHSTVHSCVNLCASPSQTTDQVQDEIDTKPTLCGMLGNSFDKEISQGVEVAVKPDPDNSEQFIKPEEESGKLVNSNHDEVVRIKLEPEEENDFSNSSHVEDSSHSEIDHAKAALPPFSEEPIRSKDHLQDPQHVVSNVVGKPFKCDLCDYQSDGRFLLEIHKKIHWRTTTIKPRPRGNPTKGGSGIKPFACDQCDYRSRWRANLTKHLVIHTGERPFECDVCGFRTAQQQSLSNHMRTHIGERRSHSHWKRSINRRKTSVASQFIAPNEDVESAVQKNSASGSVDDEMELEIEPVREELDQFIKPMHDEMDQFVRVVPDLTDPVMKPDNKKDSTVITDESVTPAYETSVYPTCPVCLKSERKMFKFRCESCRYFWNNILKKGLGPPDCPGHSSESEGLDCPGCRWGRYAIASKEWESTQSVTIRAT